MATIENRPYQIKVCKSKRAEHAKHDIKLPYDSKDVPGMPKGQYYIVEYKPVGFNLNGVFVLPTVARIPETVFNSSDQANIFELIENALASEENYTTNADGSVTIVGSKGGVQGQFIEQNTHQPFVTIGSDGNPMKDSQGNPRLAQTLKFFVHAGQDAGVRFARECQRITNRNGWVKVEPDPEEE